MSGRILKRSLINNQNYIAPNKDLDSDSNTGSDNNLTSEYLVGGMSRDNIMYSDVSNDDVGEFIFSDIYNGSDLYGGADSIEMSYDDTTQMDRYNNSVLMSETSNINTFQNNNFNDFYNESTVLKLSNDVLSNTSRLNTTQYNRYNNLSNLSPTTYMIGGDCSATSSNSANRFNNYSATSSNNSKTSRYYSNLKALNSIQEELVEENEEENTMNYTDIFYGGGKKKSRKSKKYNDSSKENETDEKQQSKKSSKKSSKKRKPNEIFSMALELRKYIADTLKIKNDTKVVRMAYEILKVIFDKNLKANKPKHDSNTVKEAKEYFHNNMNKYKNYK